MNKVISLSPEVREVVVRQKIREITNLWNRGEMAWRGRDLAEEVRIVLANAAKLGKDITAFGVEFTAPSRASRQVIRFPVTRQYLLDIAEFHRRLKQRRHSAG